MASVTLEKTYITLADDPTQSVAVRATARTRNAGAAGEVRQYAGGRLRVISSSGSPGSLSITFSTQDRALVDTLDGWAGRTVVVRDPRGRNDWCAYFTVQETDSPAGWVQVQVQPSLVSSQLEV